jgi:glycosyltransferase involved in cell wall biosynthesis
MLFRRPVSDVSAVVLTMGEPTTQDAIDSLRCQTTPVRDVIVVRDTRPFHRAINEGAARVTTPFFVQVDADMILDRHCVATLRKAMLPRVGIAVGHLRDDILHQVVGIKLFRTECFAVARFRDSISPDTDFVDEIARAGWETVYVGRRQWARSSPWTTIGDHKPGYTPAYTYQKYLMEGRRYRHRRSVGGLRWHFGQLEQSRHPAAFLAQIALARGFFRDTNRDTLGRAPSDEELTRLDAFLRSDQTASAGVSADLPSDKSPLHDRFRACFRIGKGMFDANDPTSFRRCMRILDSQAERPTAWISKMALCQGLLATAADENAIEADHARLSDFLSTADRSGFNDSSSPASASTDQSARNYSSLDDILRYAADIGLRRFVVTSPIGAEYALPAGGDSYCRTSGEVVGFTEANGRARIKVPFRPFGHIVYTEPGRTAGLAWCLDLLKAGYLYAHAPTILGAHRVLLPWQFARNVLERCGWRRVLSRPSPLPAIFSRIAKSRSPGYQPEAGRVLMVIENLIRGGTERQLVAAALGLSRRGYDVKLLCLTRLEPGSASYEAELMRHGITPEYAPDRAALVRASFRQPIDGLRPADHASLPLWLVARILAVTATIQRHRPAVVHCWLDGPGVAGALSACTLGVPRILIQQGSLAIIRRRHVQSETMLQAYRALAHSPTVTILNNSKAGARDNEDWIGLRPGTIAVLHNGFVPDSARTPEPEEIARFRASLGLSSATPVVGTIMRFVAEKDPDLWLDTAAEIAMSRPDVRFLIGGFGPLEQTMIERIDGLGLREQVVLAGPVTDAGLAYSAMDVVLLTSAIEGLPNVMIEAQAVGRPVVAPDVGGTGEAVLEGRTGVIARPRSAATLAKAVIAMLDDADWRRRVRITGPDFVAGRFGLERMVDETLGYYGFVAEHRG